MTKPFGGDESQFTGRPPGPARMMAPRSARDLAPTRVHARNRWPSTAAHRHGEPVGDFPVGQAGDNQFDDLALAAGQRDGDRRTAQRRRAQAAAFVGQSLRQRRGIKAAPAPAAGR